MHRTFEQELYEAVGRAFPGLTVRAMSKLLGKSPGYWSSMTSQKFTLPTEALMHLCDAVVCQKILLPLGSQRACHLESVQELLCEEISARLALIRAYLKDPQVSAPPQIASKAIERRFKSMSHCPFWWEGTDACPRGGSSQVQTHCGLYCKTTGQQSL